MPPCLDRSPLFVPSLMIFCKRPSTPWPPNCSGPNRPTLPACAASSGATVPGKRRGGCGGRSVHSTSTTLAKSLGRRRFLRRRSSWPRPKGRFFPLLIKPGSKRWLVRWWRRRKNRSVASRLPTWCGEAERRWVRRSAAARSGGCCTKRRSSPGNTSTGFFRGTLGSPRRPGRSWTCMRGRGKANRWARRFTCCAWTRRRAFKHVDALMTKCRPSQSEGGGLNRNTRGWLFYVVDNGSSHRGQTSVERMHRRDKRIILVHTPVHASWLNQVEIYFSIIQRKVLTPNDFAT